MNTILQHVSWTTYKKHFPEIITKEFLQQVSYCNTWLHVVYMIIKIQ